MFDAMWKPVIDAIGTDRLDFKLDDENWREVFSQPGGLVGKCHCLSAFQFVCVRFTILAIWIVAVLWSTTDSIESGSYTYWWTKLTHLGAVVELIYFGFAAFSTYQAIYGMVADGTGGKTPRFVSVTWFLSSLTPVLSLMIAILYWLLVFRPGPGKPQPLDVVMHGLNFTLAFIDLCLCRQPYYVQHVYVPFLFSLLYTVFTYVYYLLGGTDQWGEPYIYDVIDWRKPGDTGTLLGLIVILGVPVLYVILFAVVAARVRCRRRSEIEKGLFLAPRGLE